MKRGFHIPDAQLVLKNIKELSDSNTPTVAVATAIQPITHLIATQLALPSKENLVRTAQRARKQREEVLPVSTATRGFDIPDLFKNFIRFDSGQMITRGLIYSATLKCYVCFKHPTFGWLMEILKSRRKCFINFTPYTLVFQE